MSIPMAPSSEIFIDDILKKSLIFKEKRLDLIGRNIMSEMLKKWYSGKVCLLNDTEVDFDAEIQFNEYHQGIITIYGVTREILLNAEHGVYNSAIMLLKNKKYISIFDLYVKKGSANSKIIDGETVFDCGTITAVSSIILKGNRPYSTKDTFQELFMEITDGCELIGLCPYDLSKNYLDIMMYKNIEIPIQRSMIYVNTVEGEFRFSVYPEYKCSKDSFSLGFAHKIQFKPQKALRVTEIRETLIKLTSFFTILCGETVTINKLSGMEQVNPKPEIADFIGICNYEKDKLNALDNSGIDTTSFKRLSIFKISDFSDLEKAMNFWFEHYENLYNAQKAYSRILLDEELKVVSVNKFLAAMQLIEGYSQAYADEKKEIEDFEKWKADFLLKLDRMENIKEEDIEIIRDGLGFSGISFRKAVKEFFYAGSSCIETMSKTAFFQKHNTLIDNIVNDRNFYTHSSNRITVRLDFNEMINVATICKELFRVLVLNDMGIAQSVLLQRFGHSRLSVAIFERILGIKWCVPEDICGYDKTMWNFFDSSISD
ncbi:HEPN domain-containing protein [Marvinbryantia formatexigens]|nr:HEPN domain-containing protein [Marvinbryantia formatexigens]